MEAAPTAEPADALAPQPVLSARGLWRQFGDSIAVKNLTFALLPGEILGLLGPNGAGKTTTLRMVAGILPLHGGAVTVGQRDLLGEELEAKRQLVWVPDDPRPFEALTVEEHLEWTAALYRVSDWRGRAADLLAALDLSAKARALGGELSRGMRQKLALAMAFLPSPRVALLDEPLSGLDPLGIRAAKAVLRGLAREGTAIVLSSHQLPLVEELATRLLFLKGGEARFDGTLAEARARAGEEGAATLEDLFLAFTGEGREASGP